MVAHLALEAVAWGKVLGKATWRLQEGLGVDTEAMSGP